MNWISVKDRLPEEEGEYVVWPSNKYGLLTADFWPYSDFGQKVSNTFYLESEYEEVSILENITHWLQIEPPLPDKPAEEG